VEKWVRNGSIDGLIYGVESVGKWSVTLYDPSTSIILWPSHVPLTQASWPQVRLAQLWFDKN